MKYKGYSAHIEYSEEDKCLVGHIAGITDIVGFHADTVPELQEAFEEAVEDYLETCEKLGKPPQKPYSESKVTDSPQHPCGYCKGCRSEWKGP